MGLSPKSITPSRITLALLVQISAMLISVILTEQRAWIPYQEETKDLIENYQGPAFIYKKSVIIDRIKSLYEAFSDFRILYAIKANPHPTILNLLKPHIDGLDISSLGDIENALSANYSADSLSLTGPAKTEKLLTLAIEKNIRICIESLQELKQIVQIANNRNQNAKILIRINPSEGIHSFSLNAAGPKSPFGVDETQIPQLLTFCAGKKELDIEGIHLHWGSQCLSAKGLLRAYRYTIECAERLKRDFSFNSKVINLGGGIGSPYWQSAKRIGLGSLKRQVPSLKEQSTSTLEIEPGRFIIADSGIYLTKVIDIKKRNDRQFVIVDGGMHHLLLATGLWGTKEKKPLVVNLSSSSDTPQTRCTFVGALCTPMDRLGEDIQIATPKIGDYLAWLAVGAYGAHASPINFLNHPHPQHLFID